MTHSQCNINTTCELTPKENVMINKWQPDKKHPVGCYEYCGFYWINLQKDNSDRPDVGVGEGTYKGAFTFCSLITYLAELEVKKHEANVKHCIVCGEDLPKPNPCCDNDDSTECPCPETPNCEEDCKEYIDELLKQYKYLIDYFFSLDEWDEDKTYQCDEFVIFEGKIIQSIISDNDQHPHNKKAWKELGTFTDILKHTFSDENGMSLTIPYWKECTKPNCRPLVNKGSCYAVKVKKLDKDGKPEIDDCNEIIYENKIFVSLVDCNSDAPLIGSTKFPKTWAGGFTLCEYLNRPIGYTLNNEPIYSLDKKIIITSDDILAPLIIKTVNGKKYLTIQ